jgi:membrane protein DedA with SNARE-associated domain
MALRRNIILPFGAGTSQRSGLDGDPPGLRNYASGIFAHRHRIRAPESLVGVAACGDWLSYWFGFHFKDRIAHIWPLSRHPDLLPRGHAFMEKWGIPGIFIGRFFGPLRASVPLIAGILEMDYWKFQVANVLSALLWAYVLLAFGDFGFGMFKWFI